MVNVQLTPAVGVCSQNCSVCGAIFKFHSYYKNIHLHPVLKAAFKPMIDLDRVNNAILDVQAGYQFPQSFFRKFFARWEFICKTCVSKNSRFWSKRDSHVLSGG